MLMNAICDPKHGHIIVYHQGIVRLALLRVQRHSSKAEGFWVVRYRLVESDHHRHDQTGLHTNPGSDAAESG